MNDKLYNGKLYLVECYKDNKIIYVKKFNTIEEVYDFTFKNLFKKFDNFNVYKQEYHDLFEIALKNIEKLIKQL